MTKQKIIREGLIDELSGIPAVTDALADDILRYLHSKGCVLKGQSLGASHPHLANYFTTEPLIDEH